MRSSTSLLGGIYFGSHRRCSKSKTKLIFNLCRVLRVFRGCLVASQDVLE